MTTLEVTDEMKQELVDNLKDPRYYRITINGYGGESAYIKISQAAYDFWHTATEDAGDSDLVSYMINAEDGDFDFVEFDDVPEQARFMIDEDGDGWSWYDHPEEFEHTFGVNYDSAWISVDEVTNEAEHLGEVIDREEVTDLVSRVYEDSGDVHLEIQEYSCCDEHPEVEHIAQLYSVEKGTFFEGVIETHGEFDPSKLRISVMEYLNGEDTITDITYADEEIENYGGDTIGKGYTAAVFKN